MRKYNTRPPLEERFWSKVKKTDNCWIWISCINQDGYGFFSFKGKATGAHRIAWILEYGNIPKGFSVLHKCDNPPCVRLEHLFLGTQLDNIADRHRKQRDGRLTRETHGGIKLKDAQVKEIKILFTEGWSAKELASKYQVHWGTIYKILKS